MPEVPGGAAVDVVVALAFVLFILSVVSAAVVELISGARNWRGRMLRQALARLHGEERAAALYATRELAVLHGPSGRLPSYIPAHVHDGAARAVGDATPGPRFDDLMDRVSGWYKRRVQWAVLAVALLGCAAFNLDAFALGNRFLKDEAIKQAVTQQAQKSPAAGEDAVATAAQRIDELDELDLPVGWGEPNRPGDLLGWLGKLGGWFALAVSIPLGASFWFDLFSRASRQRATGIRQGTLPDDERRTVDRDDEDADGTPGPVPSA
jgi:hypothetical protein